MNKDTQSIGAKQETTEKCKKSKRTVVIYEYSIETLVTEWVSECLSERLKDKQVHNEAALLNLNCKKKILYWKLNLKQKNFCNGFPIGCLVFRFDRMPTTLSFLYLSCRAVRDCIRQIEEFAGVPADSSRSILEPW